MMYVLNITTTVISGFIFNIYKELKNMNSFFKFLNENNEPIMNHINKIGDIKWEFEEEEDNSNIFIIEILGKTHRSLFLAKDYKITWVKEYAWKFSSEEEIKNKIRNTRILELTLGRCYRIIKYDDARNH